MVEFEMLVEDKDTYRLKRAKGWKQWQGNPQILFAAVLRVTRRH